jgi:hypothetical protein
LFKTLAKEAFTELLHSGPLDLTEVPFVNGRNIGDYLVLIEEERRSRSTVRKRSARRCWTGRRSLKATATEPIAPDTPLGS